MYTNNTTKHRVMEICRAQQYFLESRSKQAGGDTNKHSLIRNISSLLLYVSTMRPLIIACTTGANILFKKVGYLRHIYCACDGFPQSEATMQSKYPQNSCLIQPPPPRKNNERELNDAGKTFRNVPSSHQKTL